MAGDHDDDRPKRSWREIDQMREKGSQSRNARSSAGPKPERSQAYRSYKSQLNRLFDGGVVPEALKSTLADKGVAIAAKQRKELAQAVVAATGTSAVRAAFAAYKTAFGSPSEEDLLAKLLDTDDEPMVLEALAGVDQLLGEGTLKRSNSLKARIKTAQMTLDSPRVTAAARDLLAKL